MSSRLRSQRRYCDSEWDYIVNVNGIKTRHNENTRSCQLRTRREILKQFEIIVASCATRIFEAEQKQQDKSSDSNSNVDCHIKNLS